MPGQQTNRHTDKINKNTSSHPTSQTKTQMVHTRMAHTLGHHYKSSSQTDRHCHTHDQKPLSYSLKIDSSQTLSCKHQRLPPNPEYQKGSTSVNQSTSFKASTRKNQSSNECQSKAKGDSNNVSLPTKTRSGRTVHLPGRYRE